jgi:hypothetical protein
MTSCHQKDGVMSAWVIIVKMVGTVTQLCMTTWGQDDIACKQHQDDLPLSSWSFIWLSSEGWGDVSSGRCTSGTWLSHINIVQHPVGTIPEATGWCIQSVTIIIVCGQQHDVKPQSDGPCKRREGWWTLTVCLSQLYPVKFMVQLHCHVRRSNILVEVSSLFVYKCVYMA